MVEGRREGERREGGRDERKCNGRPSFWTIGYKTTKVTLYQLKEYFCCQTSWNLYLSITCTYL